MPSVSMSTEFRERLIDEVKKNAILYDAEHLQHRDVDARDECWLHIAQKLGENSENLKREWKILRDSYRQSLRRRDATLKNGAPCRKWRFEAKMNFLKPHMSERERRRHTLPDTEVKTDTKSESEEEGQWDMPSHENDSLDLFFASICQSTKRLPPRTQGEIKRQVLDTITRIEEVFESDFAEGKVELDFADT